jgi:hypothetical protein
MKTIISSVEYDSDTALRLAHHATPSTDQQLFQTTEGAFFLLVLQTYVDGIKLKPYEAWLSLGPNANHTERLGFTEQIVPLQQREALEWCIKSLIPETFRGYILDSI